MQSNRFSRTEQRRSRYQLPRDLACMLAAAPVVANVIAFGCKEMSKAGVVYIDLPPGAIRFNADFELLAILVRADEPNWMEFTAIIKDKIGEQALSLPLSYDEEGNYDLAMLRVATLPSDRKFKQDHGVELDRVMIRIVEFAALVHAYAATVPSGKDENLPHLSASHPRRNGRKAHQVAKKFSLFSVQRLSSNARILGQPAVSDRDVRTAIRLDHRITVRGHFRMQAWGPGHSLRRLCWIDEHERGPEHAPQRFPMLALPSLASGLFQASA